jgi:hypothetical protein
MNSTLNLECKYVLKVEIDPNYKEIWAGKWDFF